MTTKASAIFPKNAGEVSKADLAAAIAKVQATIKTPEVTQAELDQLEQSVSALDTAVAALPTKATTDGIKADVVKLKADLTALDTTKAAASDVAALETATKALDKSLKDLAALPPDVGQSELDAAIADYTAKLKTANDAIAALQSDEVAYRTVGVGETLDLSAIKSNSAGSWAGATLSGGPLNSGSEGSGSWVYKGDDNNGTLSIVIWSAPDNRQIEGSWIVTRTNGTLGSWAIAPTKDTFQITTGATTAITGQNWAIAVGHTVTLSSVDATKSIKLKPHNTTWDKVTQYVSSGSFTVPAKPAAGSAIVELKFNSGKGAWEAVTTADPMDTRMVAVEAKAAANESAIGALTTRVVALEGTNYDLQAFSLDNGALFVANEAIGIGFVHLRSDGKIEVATDAVQDKPANGFVSSPLAAGASAKVFGSGSRVSDLGLTGVSANQRLYLGTGGDASLTSAGSNRLIQSVGIFRNNYYYLSFDDPGYWLA